MTVFFTSDHHLGHRFVGELRGFEYVTEHDEMLLERHNSVVGKRDIVWFLGDFTLGQPRAQTGWMKRANGTKHLIFGNHDRGHPMMKRWHRAYKQYAEIGFHSVAAFSRHNISGEHVLLSHFPYRDDRGDARYTQFRLPDHGMWLLHGHTHKADQRFHDHHEIHVGLDAWDFAPVPMETIQAIMREHS